MIKWPRWTSDSTCGVRAGLGSGLLHAASSIAFVVARHLQPLPDDAGQVIVVALIHGGQHFIKPQSCTGCEKLLRPHFQGRSSECLGQQSGTGVVQIDPLESCRFSNASVPVLLTLLQ